MLRGIALQQAPPLRQQFLQSPVQGVGLGGGQGSRRQSDPPGSRGVLLQALEPTLQDLDPVLQALQLGLLLQRLPFAAGTAGQGQQQRRQRSGQPQTEPPTPKLRRAVRKELKGLMMASPRMMAQPNQWK